VTITLRQFLKQVCRYGSVGLLASYPLLIERMTVLTNEYRIAVPNLPAAFAGFRIVQLTDIHYGTTILPVRFNCYPEIAVLELVPLKA
jgi:predicted MPP superfamily phosphohydrolase